MDTQKFIPYLLVVSLILLFFDYYFLRSWTRFVKRKKWDKSVYQSLWVIGVMMIFFAGYTIYKRLSSSGPDSFSRIFFFITTIWYVPKLVISPFLIAKDMVLFIVRKIRRKMPVKDKTRPEPAGRVPMILASVGWGLAIIPFIVIALNLIFTTYNFEVTKVEIPIKGLKPALDGTTIVQISDIHAGSLPSEEVMANAVNIINSLHPDLIVITGDFVNFHPNELPLIIPDLKRLKAKYGVYGCLGNHDHYMDPGDLNLLIKMLRDAGVDLLINENRIIEINNQVLQLAGIDNTSHRHNFGDFGKALEGLYRDYPIILLAHDPYNFDRSIRGKLPVELTLSGHTHGGQIVLEVFGEAFSHMRLMYNQWRGLYTYGDQSIYVTRGIGTVGAPVRISARPEITLITLREKGNNLIIR